jgi:hypothetical protein
MRASARVSPKVKAGSAFVIDAPVILSGMTTERGGDSRKLDAPSV